MILCCGVEAGGLAAERHFSARKASVLAGTGFAAALGGVNVLLGTHPTHLLTIDNGFLMFLAGSAAGTQHALHSHYTPLKPSFIELICFFTNTLLLHCSPIYPSSPFTIPTAC